MSVLIARAEVESLLQRGPAPGAHVLSVYLDVDQSKAANLNRKFEAALKQMLRSLGPKTGEFDAAADRVLRFITRYDPRGRTLVLFAQSEGLFWNRDLRVRLRSEARWNDAPYVKPLMEALDEYERFAVVLANQETARLFTVYLGEIEENREVFAGEHIKRFKQMAKDSVLSDRSAERRSDTHSHWLLKNVAETLDRLAGERAFDRLVLAGSNGITAELVKLLPKRLQARVVGSIPLAIDAGEQEVLAETLRIEEQAERSAEAALVEELITAASRQFQAAIGLQPVLDAQREGRIRKLVYAEGYQAEGSECANCRSLFAGRVESCAYCGGAIRPHADVVERLGELALASGAESEQVRGPAAGRLRAAGGIGALLRF